MGNNSQAQPLQPQDCSDEEAVAAPDDTGSVDSAVPPEALAPAAAEPGSQNNGASSTAASINREIADTWLDWQCKMIAGVIRGTLFVTSGNGDTLSQVAAWPKSGSDEPAFDSIANLALQKQQRQVLPRHRYGPDHNRYCDLLACPLMVRGKVIAIIACGVSTRSEAQQQAILQLLQWGSLWLDTLMQQQSIAAKGHESFAQKMLCDTLAHQQSRAASMEVANQLAEHFQCERVSLGFLNGLHIDLDAISNVADFDARSNLARGLEAAMEEAANQRSIVALPIFKTSAIDEKSLISAAHQRLAEAQQHPTILSIPLDNGSNKARKLIGAVTLERGSHNGFSQEEIQQLHWMCRTVGPALALKRSDERPARAHLSDSLHKKSGQLLGPENLRMKIGCAVAAALVILCSLIPGDYRVSAPAQVEAASRQVLVAPVDGFVHSVALRAGDLVDKGQQIAALQQDALQLESKSKESEILALEKEYQQALGERDRKQLSILRARLSQLEAEQQLLVDKIARTRIVAPFDGMIVSGDLSKSLGAPVKTGDVLFEVAPLNDYRVTLEIDEFDMRGVRPGKSGRLILAAMPGKPIDMTLEQLIPVAVSEDGRNYFRIEAALAGEAPELRPGMRGVAKIDMGKRSLMWIWTHSLVDRLRMWAWSVGL